MKKEKSKKRRRYDAEFKSNILKMNSDGRSVSSLALSFGISEQIIYRWRKEENQLNKSPDSQDLSELKRLRKQVKELETERDILKKALGIFSRPN